MNQPNARIRVVDTLFYLQDCLYWCM